MTRILQTILVILMPLSACADAHAADTGGDIKFDSQKAGAVHFSHDYHTRLRGLRCMACHFRMFEEAGGSYKMKKEKITKRDFCEYCHNGMKGFDAQEAKNCIRCHKK